jgi:cysteine dioxygenase
MITIHDFTQGLAAIREEDFTHQAVLDYLERNPVDLESLNPYVYFSGDQYTRNLIQSTPLYELLAICWDIGQTSPIHNHANQRCWMAIAYGRVQVQNFRLVKRNDATHYCELEATTNFIIDAERPAEVDPEEPIHLVANPSSFGSRAVTLHIYSRPFATCEIYDFKGRRFEEVQLSNSTEFGVLKSDLRLEKATLVH